MDGITKMWHSYKSGICRDTYEKQLAHFTKWITHVNKTGIQDIWLQIFSRADRNFILTGFAQEVRENNYGKIRTKKKLMADTVAATINSVSSTFRENWFGNPILDNDNQKSIFLQRQLRGFKRDDPLPQGQQCLPLSFFKSIYDDKSSLLEYLYRCQDYLYLYFIIKLREKQDIWGIILRCLNPLHGKRGRQFNRHKLIFDIFNIVMSPP